MTVNIFSIIRFCENLSIKTQKKVVSGGGGWQRRQSSWIRDTHAVQAQYLFLEREMVPQWSVKVLAFAEKFHQISLLRRWRSQNLEICCAKGAAKTLVAFFENYRKVCDENAIKVMVGCENNHRNLNII